jgi:hypothetical protein
MLVPRFRRHANPKTLAIRPVGPASHTTVKSLNEHDAHGRDRSGNPLLRELGSHSKPGIRVWPRIDWLVVLDLTANLGVWMLAVAGLFIIFA